MIEARNLSRRYGDFTAVEGVSFSVEEGEIVGMLGPNGAGKTTTLRMITGFLPPTTGEVTVAGEVLFEGSPQARRQLGYLPEQVALYPEMRVSEYLAYRARLEGLSRADEGRVLPRAVERCLLEEVRDQVIGTLSKGYKQRVGLATAILHEPKVMVLDEPTVGLDPTQIIAIRELIRDLGRERTLLLSTHILPEVELLCDRVLIIDRGRLVAEGSPEDLRRQWLGNPEVRVTLRGAGVDAPSVLDAIPGVLAVRRDELRRDETRRDSGAEGSADDPRFTLECETDADPREAVFRAAVEHGWVLLEMTERQGSLEDIFVRLTTRDTAQDRPHQGEEGHETVTDPEEVPS